MNKQMNSQNGSINPMYTRGKVSTHTKKVEISVSTHKTKVEVFPHTQKKWKYLFPQKKHTRKNFHSQKKVEIFPHIDFRELLTKLPHSILCEDIL